MESELFISMIRAYLWHGLFCGLALGWMLGSAFTFLVLKDELWFNKKVGKSQPS